MNFKNTFFFICLLTVNSTQPMDWRPTIQEVVEKKLSLDDLVLKTYYSRDSKWVGGYNKKYENGDTILHLMAKKSYYWTSVIKYASGYYASLSEKNNVGDTPLLSCIKYGEPIYLNQFCDKSSVNMKDGFGIAPIHYVIAFIQKEYAVRELLKSQADLDVEDGYVHKTPLQWIEYLENKSHIQKFENVEYGRNYAEFKKLPLLEKLYKEIKFDKEELTTIKKIICNHK